MVLAEKFKNLSTKKKAILISSVTAVIAAVVIICVILGRGYYATTMRLLRVEGTVNIEDANGNPRSVMENIRFSSGEALSTGYDGLASVGLDDTKIVTLDSDSRVEFTKSRNMLELNLTQGGLFFEVTEHLSPDETFDIRTSTMTVGIRGTSGYVFYDDDGREALVITDGCVHVVATNPETGETRETDVSGGYKVKVYLYDESRAEGSVEFFLEELEEDEIPGFPLRMLAENAALLERVCADTGWSREEILNLVNGILEPEETEETSETSEPDPTLTPTPVSEETEETEPSETPTPTPRPSPGVSPTPTPVPDPSSTPTPVPTPTMTPTPVPTPTPSPVTPTEETTPSSDPTGETDPTDPSEESEASEESTPSPEPGPEVPEEYSDFDQTVWGETYDGHDVYIISDGDGEVYMAYINDQWVEVDRQEGLNYATYAQNEYVDEEGNLYYVSDYLEYPDGLREKFPSVWGREYEGHSVYILSVYDGTRYDLGYVDGEWLPVNYSMNEDAYVYDDGNGNTIVYYRN